MADVNINKFRASVVRDGSKPASPGFIVSEGQDPVDPAGNGQNHLPVTIATAATGLSITDSQVLGGAGTVGQYIRGDGSLADFPATTGGGSSVSYYLNGSVSQGTIGGVAYKELNRTPIFGAGTDITINADGYIASFITDALDPNKLLIPAGNWNFETYFSASSSGGTPSFYVELYKYNGTTFTLIATSSAAPELIAFGTSLNPYFSTLAVPETVLALTDRLALRYYVSHSGRTITLHTENGHLCEVITTFTTGLTALNGLTNQVQFFAVGTSGTDFAISSSTSTHTFNLPTASASNRGALSSANWTTFNSKIGGTLATGQVAFGTAANTIGGDAGFTWNNSTKVLEVNGGNGFFIISSNASINSNKTSRIFGRSFANNQSTIAILDNSSGVNQITIGGGTGGGEPATSILFNTGTAGVTGAGSLRWQITNSGILQSNGAQTIQTSTGNLTIATAAGNGNILLSPNGTGVVGIGESDPSGYWVQANRLVITTAGNTGITIKSSTLGNGRLVFTDTKSTTAGLSDGGMIHYDHTSDSMRFNANGSEKIRIFSTGNVVIQNGGTFTDAGFRLDVNGTARVTGNLIANSSVGIGTTTLTGYNLHVNKNITGGSLSFGIVSAGPVQSDVTTSANYFLSQSSTAAATYTTASIFHFRASQATFGAGSTVTSQFGFQVEDNLIGATNNFAFRSQIPVGTGRWNLYMEGTAANYLAGSLGIGTTSLGGHNIRMQKSITGGVIAYGMMIQSAIQSDVTSNAVGYSTNLSTQATAFTASNITHYQALQSTIGAGSTVTNQRGFVAGGNLTGATNNYGFFGDIASGAGRWNLYMNGTAANYLAGNLLIGTATNGASKLRLVGLPTSAVGLSSGDVYNLAGVLMIA